jgi:hypothetical protein
MKIIFLGVLFNDAVKYWNYIASVTDEYIVYGYLVEMIQMKIEVFGETPCNNSHFLQHTTHTEIEPGPLRWQGGD